MIFASLIVGPLFAAGFAVMLKELVKAPMGYQDEQGFHKVADQKAVAEKARNKRARRHAVGHPSFEGFQAAHAR